MLIYSFDKTKILLLKVLSYLKKGLANGYRDIERKMSCYRKNVKKVQVIGHTSEYHLFTSRKIATVSFVFIPIPFERSTTMAGYSGVSSNNSEKKR